LFFAVAFRYISVSQPNDRLYMPTEYYERAWLRRMHRL